MYDQAVEVVLKDRKASISYVQRKLRIGYNRSARLLEDMEKAGLVSALTASGQREVLVPAREGDLPEPMAAPAREGLWASRGRASRSGVFVEKDFTAILIAASASWQALTG
jgi:hypothetical protein